MTSQDAVLKRRRQVYQLKLKRFKQVEIAQLLRLPKSTVSEDMKWCREHFEGPDLEEERKVALEETVHLVNTAWIEFSRKKEERRSLRDVVSAISLKNELLVL